MNNNSKIKLTESTLRQLINEAVAEALSGTEEVNNINWEEYLYPLSEAVANIKDVYDDFKKLYENKVVPANIIDNLLEGAMLINNVWHFVRNNVVNK